MSNKVKARLTRSAFREGVNHTTPVIGDVRKKIRREDFPEERKFHCPYCGLRAMVERKGWFGGASGVQHLWCPFCRHKAALGSSRKAIAHNCRHCGAWVLGMKARWVDNKYYECRHGCKKNA